MMAFAVHVVGCGFGGLWRFAGAFAKVGIQPQPRIPRSSDADDHLLSLSYTKSSTNLDNAELFVNCLEAMVETCLPSDDIDCELSQYPSTLSISSNMNLTSSMSSLTLGSPTERDVNVDYSVTDGSASRMRHGSAKQVKTASRTSSKIYI